MSDLTKEIQEQVAAAVAGKTPLCIVSGGTKSFYGGRSDGRTLDLSGHRGVIEYEPTELVITVRTGTRLEEMENLLVDEGQMLAFEPPHFGSGATIGGTVACGFSGPRRPYAGAARDFVLGTQLINGKGQCLHFGGKVMKNVAGYDVSRLMVGAMGTLGVLLQVSLKVLPLPKREHTLMVKMNSADAIHEMSRLAATPIPISATCHVNDELYIRLSGTERGVQSAVEKVSRQIINNTDLDVTDANSFWEALREQQLSFFQHADPLWRISLPAATLPMDIPGEWLMEWNGGLRWLITDADNRTVRDKATAAGGHATIFRGGNRDEIFHPLTTAMDKLHQNLKQAFDPYRILNPGRMYV